MMLTATQVQKIKGYADFALGLRVHTRGVVEERHRKYAAWQERQQDLNRAHTLSLSAAEINVIQADIDELRQRVAQLDEDALALNRDASAARTLVERLLAHTGVRHSDFTGDNDGALRGYRL